MMIACRMYSAYVSQPSNALLLTFTPLNVWLSPWPDRQLPLRRDGQHYTYGSCKWHLRYGEFVTTVCQVGREGCQKVCLVNMFDDWSWQRQVPTC